MFKKKKPAGKKDEKQSSLEPANEKDPRSRMEDERKSKGESLLLRLVLSLLLFCFCIVLLLVILF